MTSDVIDGAADLPDGVEPLRAEQPGAVLHKLGEFAPDEAALLLNAAVKGDRLGVVAQPGLQLAV